MLKTEIRPYEVELLRRIRNSCRQFMTNCTTEISQEEQRQWWELASVDDTLQPMLFFENDSCLAVGYGLVRHMSNRWWVSGGLLPEWREQGLGSRMFSYMTGLVHSRYSKESWLTLLVTNERARRTYSKLGYKVHQHESNRQVTTMVAEAL